MARSATDRSASTNKRNADPDDGPALFLSEQELLHLRAAVLTEDRIRIQRSAAVLAELLAGRLFSRFLFRFRRFGLCSGGSRRGGFCGQCGFPFGLQLGGFRFLCSFQLCPLCLLGGFCPRQFGFPFGLSRFLPASIRQPWLPAPPSALLVSLPEQPWRQRPSQ